MKMGFLALGHKFFLALVPEHNIFFSPRAFGPRAEKNVCVQALGPKKIYALVLKNPFIYNYISGDLWVNFNFLNRVLLVKNTATKLKIL